MSITAEEEIKIERDGDFVAISNVRSEYLYGELVKFEKTAVRIPVDVWERSRVAVVVSPSPEASDA